MIIADYAESLIELLFSAARLPKTSEIEAWLRAIGI